MCTSVWPQKSMRISARNGMLHAVRKPWERDGSCLPFKKYSGQGRRTEWPIVFYGIERSKFTSATCTLCKGFRLKTAFSIRHSFSRNVKYVSKGIGNYLRMCHANFSSLPKHMPLIENFYVLLSIKISDLKAFQRNLILLQNIMNVDHATKW